VTPIPQGIDVKKIIHNSRQSIIRTEGEFSRLRQFGEQLHQPLDFSNQQEDPLATGFPNHALRDIITDSFEGLILGFGGSGLPPSPPRSCPPSSAGESFNEDSSSSRQSQNSHTSSQMAN